MIEGESDYDVSGNFQSFIELMMHIFVEENKESINKDYIMSRLRSLNMLQPNNKKADVFEAWLDDVSRGFDDDFSLGEELFYKYAWETYKESISIIDSTDTPFKEKLMIEPVRVDYTEEEQLFKKMTDPKEGRKANDIGILFGSGALKNHIRPMLSNLITIAARPGVGKSTMMIEMCLENAKHGIKGLFVSLEMNQDQIDRKCVNWYKGYEVPEDEIEDVKKDPGFIEISENIHYVINNSNNGNVIFKTFELAIKKFGTHVIYLDYLQLVRYPNTDEWGAIRETTSRLKAFGNSNNVLMVTCSQFSRKSESYGASLGDLYGGSSIEADSDIVVGIERSDREMPEPHIKTGTISILKYRDGISEIKIPVIIDYIKQTFEKQDREG